LGKAVRTEMCFLIRYANVPETFLHVGRIQRYTVVDLIRFAHTTPQIFVWL